MKNLSFNCNPIIFNKTSSPVKPRAIPGTGAIPAIKLFQGDKSYNGYNRNKKFELKNKTQCKCCCMAGLTIGNQIYRVGAQVKYIQEYSKDHKSILGGNAVQYKSMNKTQVISKVTRKYTSITNMEELMDATEDQQSFYHDNDFDE